MVLAFIAAIIAYLGIIRIQRKWYIRRRLTEGGFILFQVLGLALLVLTATLVISTTPEAMIIGSALTIFLMVSGFLVTRWVYRKYLTPK
jgi:uncharacterized membrane protein HdeD (DUF308 family)